MDQVQVKVAERGVGIKTVMVNEGITFAEAAKQAGVNLDNIEGGIRKALFTMGGMEATLDSSITTPCILVITPNVKGGSS